MQWLLILVMLIFTGCSMGDVDEDWRCIKLEGNKRVLYMRPADHVGDVKPETPNDLWFDRLVYVHHEGKYDVINELRNPTMEDLSVTLNGAIITNRLVLTSLNPFRNIIRFRFKRFFTSVCVCRERWYVGALELNSPRYTIEGYRVVNARPVLPTRDEELPINMWHGYKNNEKLHTPIHDLVVFRVEKPFDGLIKANIYPITENWRNTGLTRLQVGPILSYLATKHDILGRDLKFAMLGDKLSPIMRIRRNMYARTYEPEENVVTNCDEWIPREWGLFICLHNLDNIKRLASGAMLYSQEKIFGVGSFALFKGNVSVLVFTDVRPYRDLIYNTCTDEDRDLKPKALN